MTILILLNTLVLAIEHYDQSIEKEEFLKLCNTCFTWLFFAEMVFKLVGLGPALYQRDIYNVFDAIVVVFSLVDFTIDVFSAQVGDHSEIQNVLIALRVVRVVRVIKLARRWEAI